MIQKDSYTFLVLSSKNIFGFWPYMGFPVKWNFLVTMWALKQEHYQLTQAIQFGDQVVQKQIIFQYYTYTTFTTKLFQ